MCKRIPACANNMLPDLFLVDGGWSLWSSWATCGGAVSCTSGSLYKRTRTCTNPEPLGDGAPCSGVTFQESSLGKFSKN